MLILNEEIRQIALYDEDCRKGNIVNREQIFMFNIHTSEHIKPIFDK